MIQAEGREVIVEIRKLTKNFDKKLVLNEIDLKLYKGETLVVIGRSGSGKSTLLWHIIGAHKPDSGSIFVFNRDILHIPEEELNYIRRRFGVVFQLGALYNSLTVGENVALALREHTRLDEDVIQVMVKMRLGIVGLAGCENLYPSELSGGMRKLASLARALVLDPEVLLYDEPTAGLDPVSTAMINNMIIQLNRELKVTSMVVTHDMRSAFTVGHRIAMLFQGRIIECDTPENIKSSENPIVRQFVEGNLEGPLSTDVKDMFESITR